MLSGNFQFQIDAWMFSTDIDECALGNHGCEETCENFGGGFFCSCQAGLRLTANGKDCEGIELYSLKGSIKRDK